MTSTDVYQEEAPTTAASLIDTLFAIPDGDRFNMCIQCGTCAGVCPYSSWMDFTPRQILGAMRMDELDEVLDSESIWMCVSCYACSDACPQEIPLSEGLMLKVKETQLLEGKVPQELQLALENSQRYGNPMGESQRKRAAWLEEIGLDMSIVAKKKRSMDILWYVGDFGSFHPRVTSITKAFARILTELGIDFAVLGPEEVSDGDSQRLAGEAGLFEFLAEKNAKAFSKYDFKEIITMDPHAYNAFRNEYPKLGFNYPVRHYTEYLVEILDQIKPHLVKEIQALVAFHDPCYLGRVNNIYDPPRELIKAIPGVQLIELSHHLSNSLCCGGGGGGMWLDGFQWDVAGNRVSDWRMGEAVAMRPVEDFISAIGTQVPKSKKKAPELPEERILAVACPYETPRFEDAAKTVQGASSVLVRDIAELLAESMGL